MPGPYRTAVCLALAAAAAAQDPAQQVDGELGRRLQQYAERCEPYGFAGAVLAARGGKVVAAIGVGEADVGVANDANTLFELASVTKQFTAAAIVLLAQRQQLALDDPIARHLPGVPDACKGITIRHLLQHTSGIPGSNGRGSGDRLDVVLPQFLAGGPQHAPGSHWEYWNQGYSLLSAIVERCAGEPYVAFCERELFAAAGMRTACFTGDDPAPGVPVAIGRSPGQAPRSALAHPYGSYGYQYRGMGGAVASVWDLWHWDRSLCGEALLGAASKRQLFTPGLEDYALGWFIRQHGDRTVQQHGGSVRGFVCDVRRHPDDDGCLFVLCNRTDAPFGELANALETLLFGGKLPLPPRPLPAAVGLALAGEWRGQASTLRIEVKAGLLRVHLRWGGEHGPATRGFVVGDALEQAALFDWHECVPVRFEPDGRTLRLAGERYERRR